MKQRSTNGQVAVRIAVEAAAHSDAYEQTCSELWKVQLQRLPLTMDFDRLLGETNLSRSKAYELLNPAHENFDLIFPQGVPLYDSERSPRFWWSHEVVAWLKQRDTNNRKKWHKGNGNEQLQ